jgi:lipopolysaccharide export system ATP-binding protein
VTTAPTDFRSFVSGLSARETPVLVALREMLAAADADGRIARARLVEAFRAAVVREIETDAGNPTSRARAERVRAMTRDAVDRYLAHEVLARLETRGWLRRDTDRNGDEILALAPEAWRALGTDRDAARRWLSDELARRAPAASGVVPFGHTLRTDGLVKVYRRRRVVDRASLVLRQGEIVGLLGPNGAGKTTTFYMIVGLIRPDAGRVFLDDEDVTGVPMYRRARKGIGYLAQEPSVFRKLTVEENLLAILETLRISKAERRRRLEALLDELSIKHLRHHKAYALSGGERRRLEITRALVTEPKFMLLDEPFAGVDPIAVDDIQRIVAGLKERGLGVLITDHNVRETLSITDRAYIMFDGRIHIEGTAEDLVNDPQARKLYLGEDFRL